MTKDEKIEKPEKTVGDGVHTVVKAGLSAIPIVGGPAAVLFNEVIVPPLARRRDEWIESIARGLKELEDKVKGFKIESLSVNETFTTSVMHATQAAMRTHHKEKLEALRNSILNSALPNSPEDNMQHLFLSLIDTSTTWHLKILGFFYHIKSYRPGAGLKPPYVHHTFLQQVLIQRFPELQDKSDVLSLLIRDLSSKGLLNLDARDTRHSKEGSSSTRAVCITDLGRQFVSFITSPLSVGELDKKM